ncbi:ATPase, T2SS/T4P/T4SS family [Gracilibacillus sp. YIM 98692]|uniref:GspE/PulE family protein n=1 Tax=Gracilibacillus sp. YIM 98692 TaxID=2663532 RepID=UPI0013D3D2BD|nr:ATPase, T2SS/T4P/T4SS family [Gracilibacillus sp. YIM 98692]
MAIRFKKIKLGELLKSADIITEEQILQALEQKQEGQKLGDALLAQGYITEKQLTDVLEQQLGIQSVTLYHYPVDPNAARQISMEFAKEHILIPIAQKDNDLTVAMSDPMDYFAIDDLEMATGFQVQPVIASKEEILQSINKYYDHDMVGSGVEVEDDAPAVRILDQILQTGVALRASDIHLEPQESHIHVRYRVDGLLRTEKTLKKQVQSALIARTKILSGLDITESRLPQDGRVRIDVDGRPIDLRVSTLPTLFGEKIVLRILDLSTAFKHLSELHLSSHHKKLFEKVIQQPSGIILITGPTGSGKTTTLYGAINQINHDSVNVVTVEDPVEYQIEGINQVQVNNSIGLTFAKGLRSILRQDPNVIMVGEIRDTETAEIAIRSALTGHLVLSTLHTNSAIDAIPRLFDMEVEPYLIVSSLTAVMAQRLVKMVCPDCREPRAVTEMERHIFVKRNHEVPTVYEGKGCSACKGIGYRGRMAIHELFVIDDTVRNMMMNQKGITEIKTYAKQNGMTFLIDDGLDKIKQGLTTLEEVLRVVAETDEVL